VTISGAGPAVIAACYEGSQRAIASAMLDTFDEHGVDARAYQSHVGRGARIY
jgi:homoserine kinase